MKTLANVLAQQANQSVEVPVVLADLTQDEIAAVGGGRWVEGTTQACFGYCTADTAPYWID